MAPKHLNRFLSAKPFATPVTSFALALLFALSPLKTQANIFGIDDRIRVQPALQSPLATIGTLTNNRDQARGTAFLVSRCLILTNAHVAFSDEKNPSVADTSQFQLLNEEPVTATPVLFGKVISEGTWQIQDDWAILKLANCLGDRYGWLKFGAIPSGMNFQPHAVQLAGFPEDKSLRGLTLDPQCLIHDPKGRHDCATRPGNSGGPLLDENLQVVGIAVSEKGSFSELILEYHASMGNGFVPVGQFIKKIQPLILSDQGGEDSSANQ
jgi:V8-like Glu-specific endopeptidase